MNVLKEFGGIGVFLAPIGCLMVVCLVPDWLRFFLVLLWIAGFFGTVAALIPGPKYRRQLAVCFLVGMVFDINLLPTLAIVSMTFGPEVG